ncbi:helix-turn-helix domain-containing protein [Leptospira sp. WS92.C1]
MFDLISFIYILKAVTIVQLGFLILNFLVRVRITYQTFLGSLFLLSLIAYFICPMLSHTEVNFVLFLFIHFGCFSVSILFYLFVSSLFMDRFKLKIWHGALFIFINLFCFYIFILSDLRNETSILSQILFSAPQLIYLGLILFTLGSVLKDKNIDLMESRREFRSIFVSITGIYAIFVVLLEVIIKSSNYSIELDFLNSLFIFILVFFFSYRLFTFRENTFLVSEAKEEEPIDESLLKKLNALLNNEKIYLKENLTILKLARQLNAQEKRVRRLINQGLGYKNFNEFLNHYRIQEAKAILADSTKGDLQVLRIAMDLGYGSLAPFNRAFREIVGMTPSDFRKQNLSQNAK